MRESGMEGRRSPHGERGLKSATLRASGGLKRISLPCDTLLSSKFAKMGRKMSQAADLGFPDPVAHGTRHYIGGSVVVLPPIPLLLGFPGIAARANIALNFRLTIERELEQIPLLGIA